MQREMRQYCFQSVLARVWTLVGLFGCFNVPSVAQARIDTFTLSPSAPAPSQSIHFCYRQNLNPFIQNGSILAEIFLTKPSDDKAIVNPPEVMSVRIRCKDGIACGVFTAPAETLAVWIVFKDTLGNVDDNNGRGYWSAMYMDNRAVPGSSASVANLLSVASVYGLKNNKSYARSLYEADFTRHPSVKRSFATNYLSTFDVHDAEDVKRFRQELFQFTRYPALSERELLAVKSYYAMIGETDSARKFDALILEKYPGGSWALLKKSLGPAMEIDQAAGLDQKWKKYQEFKATFGQSFPDALSRRQMHLRMGQILRGMVFLFAENDGLKTWEQEVNDLDAFARYGTYRRTAEQIEEKVRMSVEPAHGSIRPESSLYQSTKQEEQLLAYAESLARRSAEWYRTQLDAPRDPADPAHLYGDKLRKWRALFLSLSLDALSQILLLEHKPEEALQVIREAVKCSNYAEPTVNEHYIELLVRNNQLKEARLEASRVVRLSKSTPAIHEFYSASVKDSSRVIARSNLDNRLRKEMIREVLPGISVVDGKGKSVSLDEFKGKTVIIDFWATWCAPCIFGMAALSDVVERYKNQKDVVFLFINTEKFTDETKVKVANKLETLGYSLDVYFDPEEAARKGLKVVALPTLVVADQHGKIRFRNQGIDLSSGKQQQIDELIAMIELTRK